MSKPKVKGVCRLCLEPAELRKSHIIPKFIWRDSGLVGANKNYSVTCVSDPRYSESNRQDGFKEDLLCAECEGKFSRLESYIKPKIDGAISRSVSRPQGHFIWTGWDYAKTKLFQLSLVWRMAISSLPIYSAVELGKHEETIRRMLFKEDPGEPWRYGCASVLLAHHGKPLPDVFSQPERFRFKRQNGYRFIVAGMLWFMFVSSHRSAHFPQHYFLSQLGEWPMFVGEFNDFEFLRDQIDLLRLFTDESGRPIKPEKPDHTKASSRDKPAR